MVTTLQLALIADQASFFDPILNELRVGGFDPLWWYASTKTILAVHLEVQKHKQLDAVFIAANSTRFQIQVAFEMIKDCGLTAPIIVVAESPTGEEVRAWFKLGASDVMMLDELEQTVSVLTQAMDKYRLTQEQQRYRVRLGESEALNHAILNSFSAQVAVVDQDGIVIATNDVWAHNVRKMNEYGAASKGIGGNILDFMRQIPATNQSGNSARDEVARGIRAVLSGTLPHYKIEYSCPYPVAGSWYEIAVTPSLTAQRGATVTHLDITERKQAENSLRMFNRAVEQSASSIIITDLESHIVYVNLRFTEVTGYTAEEVIGKTPRLLKSGHLPPEVYEELWATIQSGKGWMGELYNRNKNGDLIWELVSITPIRDKQGNTTHFLDIREDITQRKLTQEALLKNELLRVELAKEREIINLKESFLSMISHEFRIPLSVIAMSHEMLTTYGDTLSNEQKHKHRHAIESQIQGMTDLLNDMLTLNDPDTLTLEFNPAPINLEAFCRDLFQQVQLTDTAGHDYFFVAEGELCSVSVDKKLLSHVLINLLSNAIKYSPTGGAIRLHLQRCGCEILISVSDEGIGIPEEDQARVFDVLQRAGNAEAINGSGLGLAIVKSKVAVHGGSISVESKLGKGSTFTVRLPSGV